MKEKTQAIATVEAELSAGALDAILTQCYGCCGEALLPYRARIVRAMRRFAEQFGNQPVQIFSVSGRTELGGNHTDHQHGRVLAAGISLDLLAIAAPTTDGTMTVCSEGYPMLVVDTALQTPQPAEIGTSAALVRGMAAGVAASAKRACGGFCAYLISDVPTGSGLSSSAAFEVMIGTICNYFFADSALSQMQIACIAQQTENRFFGKPCGLMDQMACALGGVVAMDFAEPTMPKVQRVSLPLTAEHYALCIVDSGSSHADLTAAYAAIPAEMRLVAQALGAAYLRQTQEQEFWARLPELRSICGDRAVLRAMHFYADHARVAKQVAALEAGDFAGYLQLVAASGQSSVLALQNHFDEQHPQQQGVTLALAVASHVLAGRGAVRVHGGGFAGTIQAYVPLDACADFCATMDRQFGTGACHVVQIRAIGATALADA